MEKLIAEIKKNRISAYNVSMHLSSTDTGYVVSETMAINLVKHITKFKCDKTQTGNLINLIKLHHKKVQGEGVILEEKLRSILL